MGKRTGGLLCVLLLALLPAGCQFIRIEEGERTPLEYTIVKQEEIPEEISELMEQKKKKVFQMTYQVGDIKRYSLLSTRLLNNDDEISRLSKVSKQ